MQAQALQLVVQIRFGFGVADVVFGEPQLLRRNESEQMRRGDLGVIQYGEFDVFAGGHGGGGEA